MRWAKKGFHPFLKDGIPPVHNYLKGAAKMGVPGAKTIYDDLSACFPGRPAKKVV